MIAIGLSPNTETDDIKIALKTLFQPWIWQKGAATERVEEWFKKYFQTTVAVSTNSGRSALYLLLKSFAIGPQDEIILQAFTCLAVPEVIKWLGAKPVYVDIDETLNIDPNLLEKSITHKTKAIIIQHTLGIPAQIELITKIAQENNLILIEDCAHSLGASFRRQKLGTLGDAAFFSFGRDKVISSVYGGMAILNAKSKISKIAKDRLVKLANELSTPNKTWILQQLIHPIAFFFILPLYQIGIGKIILFVLQKLRLLSFPILDEEKVGKKPSIFPQAYPNALAHLLVNQLSKLERYNNHRINMAKSYFAKLIRRNNLKLPPKLEGAIYLRFNILTKSAHDIRQKGQKAGILLGNWYHEVIDPEDSQSLVDYQYGSCPKAEKIAKMSLNLPTNIRTQSTDIDSIIKLL